MPAKHLERQLPAGADPPRHRQHRARALRRRSSAAAAARSRHTANRGARAWPIRSLRHHRHRQWARRAVRLRSGWRRPESRILMLERGEYLPRSTRQLGRHQTVFVDGKYQAPDTWYGKNGESFHPGLHYWVGGNSKVYGSALFRLPRMRTSRDHAHLRRPSPTDWPVGYDVFEPYYTQAEQLFHVHGKRGEDPTEPWSIASRIFYPPVTHEPRIQELNATLREGRSAPLPPAARHPARREGRQADADEPVHPLRCLRRLSLRDQRQGRRPGDLRRSDPEAASRQILRC